MCVWGVLPATEGGYLLCCPCLVELGREQLALKGDRLKLVVGRGSGTSKRRVKDRWEEKELWEERSWCFPDPGPAP